MRADAIARVERPVILPPTAEVLVRAPMHSLARAARRAAELGADVLTLLAVVLFIPFVILAIGIPVALGLQLLLWIGRHL